MDNLKKYGKEKHAQLGKCVKMRFSPSSLKNFCDKDLACGEYTSEQFYELAGGQSSVPVEIAIDIEGDYEAVCEQGIEIHYINEDQSEIIQRSRKLISEISEKFQWFAYEYWRMDKNEITEEELRNNYYNKLKELSESEKLEYNEMHKMLSDSNCWYATYKAGQIIHEELMKIWYPNRINN